MCGLILLLDRTGLDLEAGLDAIAHRGLPGRRGVAIEGGLGLGHVRLPIRGLGDAYDQPVYTKNYVGAFVGEIFDCPEENDTQYILNVLYSEGPQAVAEHDGFWAIVQHNLWTGETMVLVDHLAIKPLYWSAEFGAIASELRALEAAGVPMPINRHYLSDVIKFGYAPSEMTPFKGIIRMEAGCVYTFREKTLLRKKKYFPLRPLRGSDIRSLIVTAVKNRLVSDLPVSVLCSGGLDSTIVALLAAEHSKALTVFHVENNESEWLEQINWPSHVIVRKLEMGPEDHYAAFRANEEPVDLGSVVPQYCLGRAVREAGFSVCMTGDGADELFGGYGRALTYDSQYSDIFSELVHYHNIRLDKTMMASTVELRTPFLAPLVVRAALGVPYEKRTMKQVLKDAFSDIVPTAILKRKKYPLKTQAVIQGGIEYRKQLVNEFLGVLRD
jgi:asparagine synthase (glutamine-hydrolysing)